MNNNAITSIVPYPRSGCSQQALGRSSTGDRAWTALAHSEGCTDYGLLLLLLLLLF